jgi:hypothetical protein
MLNKDEITTENGYISDGGYMFDIVGMSIELFTPSFGDIMLGWTKTLFPLGVVVMLLRSAPP